MKIGRKRLRLILHRLRVSIYFSLWRVPDQPSKCDKLIDASIGRVWLQWDWALAGAVPVLERM